MPWRSQLPASIAAEHGGRVDNGLVLLQIEHPVTKQRYSFWWDRPHVEMPVKEDSASELDKRLMPRDCREMVSSM